MHLQKTISQAKQANSTMLKDHGHSALSYIKKATHNGKR